MSDGTHIVKVPGGEVVVRDFPSLYSFIFWLASIGCVGVFVASGLQRDFGTALTGLFMCGIMMLGSIALKDKAI